MSAQKTGNENRSLMERAVKGVLWTGAAKFITQGLLLIVTVILARLLTPDDFGLVGMATLITVAVTLVNDRGLGTAIIQKKQIEERHLSSIFWTSIVFGGVLFTIAAACSGVFAAFFKNELVAPIVIIMGISFIIGGFGIVHKALLFRTLDFKTLAIVESSGVIGYGVVAITMAWKGFGVWSLVWSALVKDLVVVVLLWLTGRWHPRFLFHWPSLRELLGFGANVLGIDVMLYVNSSVDYLLIGRLLGAAPLGYYSLALNLVKMPVQRLSGVVSKVAFPAFSEVQDDLVRFRAGFIKSIQYISVITFPLLAGLMIFAKEVVIVFLGSKWLPMVVPLQILCPVGILKSVGTTRGSVLAACGRPDIEFRWNVVYLPPLVAVLWLGARFGLIGVVIGFTSLYVVTFPIIQAITNKQINLPAKVYLDALLPVTMATLIMAFSVGVIKIFFSRVFNVSELALLLMGVGIGILSYLVALLRIRRNLLTGFIQLFKARKGATTLERDISPAIEAEPV